ncbi:MAG: L,D-transpeptidase family protein [Myxococcota bacterium]
MVLTTLVGLSSCARAGDSDSASGANDPAADEVEGTDEPLPPASAHSRDDASAEVATDRPHAEPPTTDIAPPRTAESGTPAPPPKTPGGDLAHATSAAPIGRRRAKKPLMIYEQPQLGTEFRGKIPHGEVFELFELVEGPECRGEGWGRIGDAAYVCLRHTEPTEDVALALPTELVDGLAPFHYARLKPKGGDGNNPPAPLWRSRTAMRRGAEPESFLQPEHDYAFVKRRRLRSGAMLYTPSKRVVREADIKRMKPSDFAGRDVASRPIPAGVVMSWSITWPFAAVHAEPKESSPVTGKLPLHEELMVHDEPKTERGLTWYPVAEPHTGWVQAEQIRRWNPMKAPADVEALEPWIDVDLSQQVLALRRGGEVEFVTLISSGNWKHATPRGIFRLESKWAFADMRSRAGDDDTYYVEGVPWAMYFRGRYALHGTFWHNRFGRRTSHGCINLSAHDARYVYERTAPIAKPGWVVTHEHLKEPGTLIRIRRGDEVPPDRRRSPRGTAD